MRINLKFVLLNRWLCLKNGHLVKDGFLPWNVIIKKKEWLKRKGQADWKKCGALWIKNNHKHLEELKLLEPYDYLGFILYNKAYLRWSVLPGVLYMRIGSFPSSSSQFLMVSVLMECKQAVASYSDMRESPV